MFRRQTTLAHYCNPDQCKLFYTKADSTPLEYTGLFHAAMAFREARLCELRAEMAELESTLPAWAVEAYKAAERSFRLVENESSKDKEKADNNMKIVPTGSTAFAAIEAAVAARVTTSNDSGEELEKLFDRNPDLSSEIFKFIEDNQ